MEVLPQHARKVERIDVREYTGSGMRFRNGDTLIARITPCLENGKTAFVSELKRERLLTVPLNTSCLVERMEKQTRYLATIWRDPQSFEDMSSVIWKVHLAGSVCLRQ